MKLHIGSNQMEVVEGLRNEYPYAYHYADLGKTLVPWHWHEALEINFVAEGSVKVCTASQSQIFSKGEAFFLNSNVLASMENQNDCIMESHLFHPVFLSGHFKSIFETKYLNPVIQNKKLDLLALRGNTPEEKQIIGKLRQLSRLQAEPDPEFQTRNLLSDIWLLLLRQIQNADSHIFHAPKKNQDRILTMLSYMHENFAEKLTLEQIAESAAVSVRECLRCFRESIHQSPMDYLIEYRIQRAKKMLEHTDLSITDVALHCGFSNNSYFTKRFHSSTGQTPNTYRKAFQNLGERIK